MPKVAPYLTFDGNCADAMRFYERTLGGKLEMIMTHAQSPMAAQAPPGSANLVLHVRLLIDGRVLMACNATLDEPYEAMKGVAIALNYPTATEARRAFDALAEAGEVRVQLQPTYHAEAFGKLVDRYGTSWMIGGGPLNT